MMAQLRMGVGQVVQPVAVDEKVRHDRYQKIE
jgi:hypothetical protein